MEKIFSIFLDLLGEIEFTSFQNDLAQAMYNALGTGYLNKEHEVPLVTRLVDAINGKSYRYFKIFSQKIHGSRSYVKFNYQDKPTSKELADMVVISLVTNKRERILQRISFVQNKVSHGNNSWNIDEEQLFLLKNFPPFSGEIGIFSGHKEILLKNHSKCLGAFGLFDSPGEMIFISAPLLSEFKRGKKSVSSKDISFSSPSINCGTNNASFLPGFMDFDPFIYEELFYYMIKRVGKYPFPFFHVPFNIPCLGNEIFARDLYDFARNWTQMNIGEYSFAFGRNISPALDNWANYLMHSIGIGEYVDLPINHEYGKLKNEVGIMVMHTDISLKK